jgi:hypothetical protein
MEEINDIAHFAKGSLVLKNHYTISDPQRRIHALIGNVISSDERQVSASIPSFLSPSLLSSSSSNNQYISSEELNTVNSNQSGIPSHCVTLFMRLIVCYMFCVHTSWRRRMMVSPYVSMLLTACPGIRGSPNSSTLVGLRHNETKPLHQFLT